MSGDATITKIIGVVGREHVLTDPSVMDAFLVDWTGRYRGSALAVIRPANTREIARVLRICQQSGLSVIPQGGNTGLVGGSIPEASGDSIVLSLSRLTIIGEVDSVAGRVSCGAGVTLASLQTHVRASEWECGVDLAARDSATIGGMVATNAGGIHVVGNGMMRTQVLGVEAVLASGDVVRSMSGLAKNNTGYDFPQLLCGSEGTLGVITEVSLQLVRPRATELAVVGCSSVAESVEIASRFVGRLAAAEIMDRAGLGSVARVTGISIPFDSPFHLLLEIVGEIDEGDLDDLAWVTIAQDAGDRVNLWSLRERITEAVAVEATGVSHKLDISVPLAELDSVYREIVELLSDSSSMSSHGATVKSSGVVATGVVASGIVIFGHLMDGNFHLFFTTDSDDESLDVAVLELVASHGGSISAEHGVGRMKAAHLHLSRSSAEISAMRAIKGALDPTGILNPGVLLA